MPEAREVRAMFGRIAPRYDLLNHVLSVGIDRRWRKRLLRIVGDVRGTRALDACCGTGDLSLLLAREGAAVIGVDFTHEMLLRAEVKRGSARSVFVHGDALNLPNRTGSVDVSTVAFGIRNVADRGRGLAELSRVVRPGGHVLVLEFSQPPNRLLAACYGFYFTRVLPRIGGFVSGDMGAYRYLPETVAAWPSPAELKAEMEAAGLVKCGFERLSGGIACLSYGRVPIQAETPA